MYFFIFLVNIFLISLYYVNFLNYYFYNIVNLVLIYFNLLKAEEDNFFYIGIFFALSDFLTGHLVGISSVIFVLYYYKFLRNDKNRILNKRVESKDLLLNSLKFFIIFKITNFSLKGLQVKLGL
jgi:hypothetical protein